MELKTTPSLFVALAESIVYQQLTGKAAATIFARVQALFPRAHHGPTPEQILRVERRAAPRRRPVQRQAPRAARPGAAERRRHGADARRAAQRLDDETLVARLTEVRGIGRWTVEMLLMFRLGRPDVLPVDDYGVRQGFAIAIASGRHRLCRRRWRNTARVGAVSNRRELVPVARRRPVEARRSLDVSRDGTGGSFAAAQSSAQALAPLARVTG